MRETLISSNELSPMNAESNSYLGFQPRVIIGNNTSRFGIGALWGNQIYISQKMSTYVEIDASLLYSADVIDLPLIPVLSFTSGMNFHFNHRFTNRFTKGVLI